MFACVHHKPERIEAVNESAKPGYLNTAPQPAAESLRFSASESSVLLAGETTQKNLEPPKQ
jgi:hypothetical protein